MPLACAAEGVSAAVVARCGWAAGRYETEAAHDGMQAGAYGGAQHADEFVAANKAGF